MGSVGQYTQGWLPWQAEKAKSGAWSRLNNSALLGMGDYANTPAQNEYIETDVWFDTGTWKFACVHYTNTDAGILTVNFNGVSQGTIDFYSAAPATVYSELTGLSVTTAGVVTVRTIMATKNASSSNYQAYFESFALIRTSGTASTPAGSDTPGYTWQYLPWMGSKSNTNWATNQQLSSDLGGGMSHTDTNVQNNAISFDVWLDTGTYKVALVYRKDSDKGIHNLQLGGSTKGTVDSYSASTVDNNYTEVTGIAVSIAATTTFQDLMATKNASSTGYAGYLNSVAWIRTGA